jgi:hypothetical protein
MVEGGGALVETAGVPGIAQLQPLEIEMMAELVAEGAEEGAEAGDVFADGRTHPDADEMSGGLVVAEQFRGGILANAQRACGEDLDPAAGDFVKVGGGGKEGITGAADVAAGAFIHGGLDFGGDMREFSVGGKRDGLEAIAVQKTRKVFGARRGVGEHDRFIFARSWRPDECGARPSEADGGRKQHSPVMAERSGGNRHATREVRLAVG